MAAGGPGVTVLAPNGRRQTVKVTARTPLLQVLEEVCKKQNFNPREYSLKFQRTVLDLSLQWRFANLPNNASLEMVRCAQERVAAERTKVRVAVQLETGERLQDEFISSQTLWEILSHFLQTRTCVEQVASGYCPVCIYMRDEVTGEMALKQTSLQSLGLTGGSAIIRFVMKKCDQPVSNVPLTIQDAKHSAKCPMSEEEGEQHAVLEHMNHPVKTEEKIQPPVLEKESEQPSVTKEETRQSAESEKEQVVTRQSAESEKEQVETTINQVVKDPEKPANIVETGGNVGASGFVPKTCPWSKEQQISENRALNHAGLLPSAVSAPPQVHTQTTSFIPFQGGGHRLGGANVPAGPSEADVPNATAKEPVCSPGPSKPKKSKTSDEEDTGGQPIERKPLVFNMDLEEQISDQSVEPTDEFFEITVDDVRRRFAQLKSERKRLEEAPLMTKVLRESQMKEKLDRYPKVVLRVLFPDRCILQGFFSPTETVGAVKEFVRSHLEDSKLQFYLFITPPRTELKEDNNTLFQADLFPAALIHFGTQTPRDHFLRRQLLATSVSSSQADILVARTMPHIPTPSSSPSLSTGNDFEPDEPLKERLVDQEEETAQEHQQQGQVETGKVPKWLKLPGKK
ncbi:tether containing UBX domain for GLUT4 [Bombina bombina]|uniref:tether containing UBX domain for GLUT4 n=1 Tax=Bombina bombina TaxID=8345 RepID=UPI00235B3025|nr:tether containing UBX domain for GLUT4 [Bombina bombina]